MNRRNFITNTAASILPITLLDKMVIKPKTEEYGFNFISTKPYVPKVITKPTEPLSRKLYNYDVYSFDTGLYTLKHAVISPNRFRKEFDNSVIFRRNVVAVSKTSDDTEVNEIVIESIFNRLTEDKSSYSEKPVVQNKTFMMLNEYEKYQTQYMNKLNNFLKLHKHTVDVYCDLESFIQTNNGDMSPEFIADIRQYHFNN